MYNVHVHVLQSTGELIKLHVTEAETYDRCLSVVLGAVT